MDMRASLACYHCGAALPEDPDFACVAGDEHPFCCSGCAAAANWIAGAALDDYYRLRNATAGRVDSQAGDFCGWDNEAVLAEHSRVTGDGREITVLTDAMRCAACAWLIDRALRLQPGVLEAGANAITGRITVRWDPARTLLSTLMARLAALGYRPWLATGEAREQARRQERRKWLMRVGVAGLGAMQAMMFAEALYFDSRGEMALATRDFLRWVTCLVATPVVFYSGWPFLQGMLHELRNRRLGMDTLVAGSTLLAFVASVFETVRGGPDVWYDAAVMFVLLLLVARMLEQRARGIASAQVDALARARPALASRELAGGAWESVSVTDLAVGELIRVMPGEPVPADGELCDSDGEFDEALVSGESAPVLRRVGDTALAGSICQGRMARIRITRVGNDTRLSQLTRLVEQAQATRPRLARVADRVASGFVLGLIVCAVAVYAWWHQHDPSRALEITLALLVVSCPCALSLAIPVALTAAHGSLARLGVLALRADALSRLARVDRVVFDKTGTVTTGTAELLTATVFAAGERAHLLEVAAALELDAKHPIARALAPYRGSLTASAVTSRAGLGIEGVVDGNRWRLGRADFAAGRALDDSVWLGDGLVAHARFQFAESLRPDAIEAVSGLRQLGLSVELCSGDSNEAVARVGAQLGICEVSARCSPEHKLEHLRRLQAAGHVVAMVGDGINDAPVLAGADVSLAMADGAALAQHAADLVITSPSLSRLADAIALARRTRSVVWQNLAWALAYNLVALPAAAMGLVTPWLAALGMSASSLLVTLNALRLTRRRS